MSVEIERKFLVLGDDWKKLGQAVAIRPVSYTHLRAHET